MDETELKEYLVRFVQEYGTKYNELEDEMREKSKAADDARPKFSSDEEKFAWLKENKPINWFHEFTRLYAPIYDRYCTDKKRAYGGKEIHSFGWPTKFNGMEAPLETTAEFKNKNRAEVYFKTGTNFKDEYLFVVLRKGGEWKIDSYKNRRYGNEKWDNKIL